MPKKKFEEDMKVDVASELLKFLKRFNYNSVRITVEVEEDDYDPLKSMFDLLLEDPLNELVGFQKSSDKQSIEEGASVLEGSKTVENFQEETIQESFHIAKSLESYKDEFQDEEGHFARFILSDMAQEVSNIEQRFSTKIRLNKSNPKEISIECESKKVFEEVKKELQKLIRSIHVEYLNSIPFENLLKESFIMHNFLRDKRLTLSPANNSKLTVKNTKGYYLYALDRTSLDAGINFFSEERWKTLPIIIRKYDEQSNFSQNEAFRKIQFLEHLCNMEDNLKGEKGFIMNVFQDKQNICESKLLVYLSSPNVPSEANEMWESLKYNFFRLIVTYTLVLRDYANKPKEKEDWDSEIGFFTTSIPARETLFRCFTGFAPVILEYLERNIEKERKFGRINDIELHPLLMEREYFSHVEKKYHYVKKIRTASLTLNQVRKDELVTDLLRFAIHGISPQLRRGFSQKNFVIQVKSNPSNGVQKKPEPLGHEGKGLSKANLNQEEETKFRAQNKEQPRLIEVANQRNGPTNQNQQEIQNFQEIFNVMKAGFGRVKIEDVQITKNTDLEAKFQEAAHEKKIEKGFLAIPKESTGFFKGPGFVCDEDIILYRVADNPWYFIQEKSCYTDEDGRLHIFCVRCINDGVSIKQGNFRLFHVMEDYAIIADNLILFKLIND
eukprot:TRINITY_DN6616_c0_g1_i5.p1 TRINITY_DN6616_c0_g1~~TRINITY_DN6616_c0_g1_i5.p1  ORF type:complete len:669 (+),score=77.02 TRINITY_DN6616_c0_g1_i5:127-2133(+)